MPQEPNEPSPQAAFPRAGTGAYEVRVGDCMSSIAHTHGFYWETLWDHADNAALRRERDDPALLVDGDRVAIPPRVAKAVACEVDRRHRFRRRGVPEVLRLRFLDEEEQPRAGLTYVLEIEGTPHEGETDDDGYIEVWISPQLRHAKLMLLDSVTRRVLDTYDLGVGELEPIDSPEGTAARLANLGSFTPGSELAGRVAAFQGQHGLEQTGEMDDATRAKLSALTGG